MESIILGYQTFFFKGHFLFRPIRGLVVITPNLIGHFLAKAYMLKDKGERSGRRGYGFHIWSNRKKIKRLAQ